MPAILGLAATGYVKFKETAFLLNPAPDLAQIEIILEGDMDTPLKMARNVSIPLENALQQLDQLSSIHSVSSSGSSRIQLVFESDQAPVTQILKIMARPGLIPKNLSSPKIYRSGATMQIMEIVFWRADSLWSYHQLRTFCDSTFHWLNRTFQMNPVQPKSKENNEEYIFSQGTALSQELNKRLQADSGNIIYLGNTVVQRSNLITPLYKNKLPRPSVRINSYPGIRFHFEPLEGQNVLWERLKLEFKMHQLGSTGIRHTFITDPFAGLFSDIKLAMIRLGILFIICLITGRKRSLTLLYALTIPGIFFLIHFLFDISLSVHSFIYLEMAGIFWTVYCISEQFRQSHLITSIILCLALSATFVSLSGKLNFQEQIMVTGAAITGITLLLHLPLSGIIDCRNTHYRFSAAPALICTGLLAFTWCSREFTHSGYSPVHDTRESRNILPPDREDDKLHVSILGKSKSFSGSLPENIADSVQRLLEQYHPDILKYSRSGEDGIMLSAAWERNKVNAPALKRSLTRLFDLHDGIRWQLDGLGDPYQNDHLIMPGTYSFTLTGYDFEKLLQVAETTGDSIAQLPGVGFCHVNSLHRDGMNQYTLVRKSDQLLHPAGAPLFPDLFQVKDTMRLMHIPSFENGLFGAPLANYYSLHADRSPAPVSRTNNTFRIGINYSHYGQAKYSKKFYDDLIRGIDARLPFGFKIEPVKNSEGIKRYKIVYLAVWLTVTIILLRILRADWRQPANCAALLLLISLTLRNWQGFAFSHTDTAEIVFMILFYCIPGESVIRRRMICMLLLFAISSCLLLVYHTGNQLIRIQHAMCLSGALLVYDTLQYGVNSIASRGYGIKKLLDFFRLGMVAQLFK